MACCTVPNVVPGRTSTVTVWAVVRTPLSAVTVNVSVVVSAAL